MLTHQAVVLSLNLLLWIFFAYRFVLALKHRKLRDPHALLAWSVFFCLYLIAALTVHELEAFIDMCLGGIPITNLARSVMILMTTQFVMLIVGSDAPVSDSLMRVYLRINPMLAVGLIALFAGMVAADIPYAVNWHLIKAVRDALMILWGLLIILPTFFHLWRVEQVRPTKLRYGLCAVFGIAYVLQCATSLGAAWAWAAASALEPPLLSLANLFTSLCIGLMMSMLIPYRWLMWVFYPRRRQLLRRLQRLEARVTLWAAEAPILPALPLRLIHPNQVELGIYQAAINILDMLPTLRPGYQAERERIEALVHQASSFSDLTERMGKL